MGNDTVPAVDARGIGKRFGGTVALQDVSFGLHAGRVHALIGENGAGKSTALGIVAGRIGHDSGSVTIMGRPVRNPTPRRSRSLGVAAIYQELTVLPAMSAMANVFVGATPSIAGMVHRRAQLDRFGELAAMLDVRVRPAARAGDLSVADQQILEIMRALHTEARVLLFDEPTAALAAPERARLLGLMRTLRGRGVSMALVSHDLDEVLEIADEITVFRDGRVVASGPRDGWTRGDLVAAMLGDAAAAMNGTDLPPHRPDAWPAGLEVRDLHIPGRIRIASLRVGAGEIVGVAGLVGSGRSTLLRALVGLEPGSRGVLAIGGDALPWPRSMAAAVRDGIGYVPEDRKSQGLVLTLPAADNIVLAGLPAVARRGVVSRPALRRAAAAAGDRFGLPAAMHHRPVRTLSGGNQQKAMLARWAHRQPRVLLADEPTRGIDVGAKATIMRSLAQLAAHGLAMLVVSSDHEELLGMADRIVVIARGRIVAELDNRARSVTEEHILQAAFAAASCTEEVPGVDD